jgi:hypothetical protein
MDRTSPDLIARLMRADEVAASSAAGA